MPFNRRRFIQAAGVASLGLPRWASAQETPIRLGLMTVKTGPLASGGIDMDRALVQYLKERNNTLAGHEMCAGFMRVFEENGGKVVQRMFPPLTVPDYGTYLAQLKTNIDAVFLGFAGSNGFRYLRQFNEYGLLGKVKPVGGMTALDEAVLRNMGDEALGIVTSCWYSAEIDNPVNQKFVAALRNDWKYDPGFYAAATYTEAAVLEATLNAIKGRIEDKQAFMKAVRSAKVDTCRGPVSFDQYGNVVGNIYIRRVERKEGRLVNRVIHTYPNVSQFWTYKPEEFLKNPVYSRDFPPAKTLEA